MAINYKTGSLDEALKAIDFEAVGELSDYEKHKLALELLKVAALRDAIDALTNGMDRVRESVEMHE